MAYMIEDIDEAIDHKYIVTKTLSRQAKAGTMVHIMDSFQNQDGITVNYRVTETGQDFMVRFDNLKQFCKWCRPDSFIARHYESLSKSDIVRYMKVTGRTFASFCLPAILLVLALIWAVSLLLIKDNVGIIVGAVLSVIAIFVIILIYKMQKTKATVKLYSKEGDKWGVSFK